MKKIAAIALVSLLLAGGGSSLPSSAADKVVLKIGTTLPAEHPVGQGALRFKQLVEERSKGTITVQIFPNNQLGGEPEMFQQEKQGSIQMLVSGAGTAGNLVPDIAVLEAPYLWRDFDHEKKVMSAGAPIFTHFQEEFEKAQGLKLLSATWYYGLRNLTANKPVRKPEDAAGMKIRTPPSPVNLLAGRVLGGQPTPMNFPQVYLAIKTGTIDAEENPLPTIVSSKMYEVNKFINLTRHIQQSQLVTINEAFFNSLTKEQQQAVTSAVNDAALYETELAKKAEAEDLGKLRGMPGVTIVSDVDYAAFRARAKTMVGEMKDKWGDLYDRIAAQQ